MFDWYIRITEYVHIFQIPEILSILEMNIKTKNVFFLINVKHYIACKEGMKGLINHIHLF